MATVLTCLFEGIVGKAPVVTMVVLDADPMLGCILFKGLLGKNGLGRSIIDLEMDESQMGVVVHKNGAASVPLLGECPLELGKESQFGRYHLVD